MSVTQDRLLQGIEALESGEYTQATGCLRLDNGGYSSSFCCLGVLTEVYRCATGKGYWSESDDRAEYRPHFQADDRDDFSSQYLPDEVRGWYGFDSNDPLIAADLCATGANDEKHMTFVQIASLLRKRYVSADAQEKPEEELVTA